MSSRAGQLPCVLVHRSQAQLHVSSEWNWGLCKGDVCSYTCRCDCEHTRVSNVTLVALSRNPIFSSVLFDAHGRAGREAGRGGGEREAGGGEGFCSA